VPSLELVNKRASNASDASRRLVCRIAAISSLRWAVVKSPSLPVEPDSRRTYVRGSDNPRTTFAICDASYNGPL
jgi:hypothetical protein